MLRLIWRESARGDARAIFNYIAERNVAAEAVEIVSVVHARQEYP